MSINKNLAIQRNGLLVVIQQYQYLFIQMKARTCAYSISYYFSRIIRVTLLTVLMGAKVFLSTVVAQSNHYIYINSPGFSVCNYNNDCDNEVVTKKIIISQTTGCGAGIVSTISNTGTCTYATASRNTAMRFSYTYTNNCRVLSPPSITENCSYNITVDFQFSDTEIEYGRIYSITGGYNDFPGMCQAVNIPYSGSIEYGISPPRPALLKDTNGNEIFILTEGCTDRIIPKVGDNSVSFPDYTGTYGYEIQWSSTGVADTWNDYYEIPACSELTETTTHGKRLYLRTRIYRNGPSSSIKYSPYLQTTIEVAPRVVTLEGYDPFYCKETATTVRFNVGTILSKDSVIVSTIVNNGNGQKDSILARFDATHSNKIVSIQPFKALQGTINYKYKAYPTFKLLYGFSEYVSITATKPLIELTSNATNILCNGENSIITLTASGGNPNYTFALEGETYNSGSNASFTRGAGDYTVIVTDSRTCKAIKNITISQPYPLEIDQIIPKHITCFGGNDGIINITAKGGKGTYKYHLKKGETLVKTDTTGIFNSLTAGDYKVTIQNSNETCNSITSNTITLTQPANPVGGNIDKTNVSCKGEKSGSIVVSGKDGVSPYTYSLNGSLFQGSGEFLGLAADNHIIKVKDYNGCISANFDVVINQPDSRVVAEITNHTDVLCFGYNTGNVTIAASGGTGRLSYSKDNYTWQETNSFIDLNAKPYLFLVKDENQCKVEIPFTITQPSLGVSGSITNKIDVSCYSGNDGAVTIAGDGGNYGFSYCIDGGNYQPSGTFQGLKEGSHTITVRDINLCTANVPVIIAQPNPLLGSATIKDITCFGSNNGEITISPNGGTPPYIYSIDNGSNFSAPSNNNSFNFNNLTKDSYKIVIRDFKNCEHKWDSYIVIKEPTEFKISSTKKDIACFGQQNGTITITPNGGTPPYIYSYNGGHDTLPLNNSMYSFENLEKGIYSITAKDANGCESEKVNIPITEPTKLLASSKKVDLRCFNTNDGSITIKATDGTKPYWISNDYGSSFVKTDSSYTFTALSAKTYGLVIKDFNNCNADIENVTLTQPSFFTLAVENFADVSCNNGNNGWVQLTASGGNPTLSGGKLVYSFSKDNAVWIDSVSPFTINQLQAKDYQFSVKDTQGCEAKVSHTVNQPQPISISKSITNIKCKGESNGKIVFEVLGGKSPYIVKTSFPDKQTDTKSNVNQPIEYSSLKVGNYSLSITDSFGCSSDFNFEIKEPEQTIELSVDSIQMPSCYGDSNGNAFLSSNGGWGKYMYSIDSISKTSTNGTFSGLAKGKYRVTAVDSLGCSTETSIVVNQPDSLILLEPIVTPLSCKENGTGVIELSALGGTPNYDFGVGGSYTKDNKRQNLAAGNYNVSVRDSKGCTATTRVTVNEPERLIVSLSNTNYSGFSVSCTDSVRVKPMGGIAPYTIHFDDKDSLCSAAGYLIHSRPSGSYPLLISDSNGCTAKATAVVSNLPGPKINGIEVSNASCSYSSDGKISIHTSTLTNSVRVEWENGRVGNSIDNLPGGYYRAIAIDEFGCSSDTLIAVSKPDSLIVNLVELKHPTCFGFADGTISVNATGGNNTSTYKYQWNNNVQDYSTGLVPSGNYTLVVTDSKGCVANAAFSLTDPPSVQPSIPLEVTICSNQTYIAKAGVPGLSFLWFSENGFAANTPNVELSNTGVYYLLVTDGNGCMGRDTLTLKTDAGIIDADFLMADSASIGDTLAIVETSWPVPQALQWIYPSAFRELKRTEYTIYLIPEIEGVFPIGLFTYVGPCSEYIEKQIKIGKSKPKPVEKTTIEPIIKSALVVPNPNNGRFNLVVDLSRDNGIVVEIFTMYGEKIMRNEFGGLNAYSIETNIKNLPGMYLVKVSAGKENKSLRVIIQ